VQFVEVPGKFRIIGYVSHYLIDIGLRYMGFRKAFPHRQDKRLSHGIHILCIYIIFGSFG